MRQFLIVDADDTLWENNIYFERAFDDFCDFLSHSRLDRNQVRAVLDQIERVNNQAHGYGSRNFARNMVECYRRLAERNIEPADIERILALADAIMAQPVELLPGVPETLEALAGRHELTLFTKGHPEEQKLKIDRSGLGRFFAHTAIVKEKDAPSYRELVRSRGMDPARTWMIGNSPKSDVNPALEAGLGAVFVPHDRTWHLELQEIPASAPRLLVIERFADLRLYF